MVYPEGMNWALKLVVPSLPESLAHGMNMLNESTFLLVNLSRASALHNTSAPTSPTHLTMKHPSGVGGYISITAEVQDLFSHVALDTSSQASGGPTMKRPASTTLGAPPSSKVEDSSELLATSSQASLQVATSKVTNQSTTLPHQPKLPGLVQGPSLRK